MLRKSLLLLAALLFAAGANLRPVCRYELAGEPIAPGCGIRTAALAERTARAAAEEILRAEAAPGAVTKRLCLSLRKPAGSSQELADALLRSTAGVALRCEVRVDGRRPGVLLRPDGTIRQSVKQAPTPRRGGLCIPVWGFILEPHENL